MDFFNAVRLVHGSPNLACLLIQNYLIGPARIWLNDLPEKSIFCWFDLKEAFEAHFKGTYKRPHTTSDMQMCVQKKDETSREYLTRWVDTRNACESVDDKTAILAFVGGLCRGNLLQYNLKVNLNAGTLTLSDMICDASNAVAADDDAGGVMQAMAVPNT